MDKIKKSAVWIRLAVSNQRIQNGDPRHWRCFIDPSTEEIPLVRCVVTGVASSQNCRTMSQVKRDAKRQLVAWIWYFGNVEIGDDNVAHIELLTPSNDPKN